MGKILIIAEAGVNHNGSLETAYKLIDVAFEAGVDIVKFQTFHAEKVVSVFAEKASYQKQTTNVNESQLEMIKKLELSHDDHRKLLLYCQTKGIKFLSTPFDLESIDFLNELGLDIFKIPSGEITNLPYLRKIAKLQKKVVISTGMANMKEIGNALNILIEGGTLKTDITILHCNTEYPTPMRDVNLKAILSLRDEFGVKVGYSDHTLGIEVSIAAVALGATVIEKHFTLDKKMAGPDHQASIEPDGLKVLVNAIRNIEKAMGDGVKKTTESEKKNIAIARKSIVAKTEIKKGDIFTDKNLTVKRPGTGISPMEWDSMLGREAKRDFFEDELIEI
jgi:N,N'-diacetyllegionaminate synthase